METKISTQEYNQVMNILDRYNATDAIEVGEMLVEAVTTTYRKFLIHQPEAVAVLAQAQNPNLIAFVEDLGRINELLYNLNNAHNLLPLADLLNDLLAMSRAEYVVGVGCSA